MVSVKVRLLAVLAIFALALAGCGGSDSEDDDGGGSGGSPGGGGGGDLGACVVTGACLWYRNYPAGSGAAEAAFADACGQSGGTWGDACPTEGLVGICSNSAAGASAENWYYDGAAADLEAGCAAGGGTFRTTP